MNELCSELIFDCDKVKKEVTAEVSLQPFIKLDEFFEFKFKI